MPLKYPGEWRFTPPLDGHFINKAIPQPAIGDFSTLIDRIPAPRGRWGLLEHFKSKFGSSSTSSSESWALSDLMEAMGVAAENAPLFIEQFFDGCQSLESKKDDWFVPDAALINSILIKHNIGYEIRPPHLLARESGGPTITIPVSAPSRTLGQRAGEVLDASLKRSEQLLQENRTREAVQEILWLLETVTTAFKGLETQSGQVEGKYFNQIVRDLRAKRSGTTLEQVLNWISTMHGYLSSPTGGGVRHGIDLAAGVDLDPSAARLFCNLTRSYISFLIVEHENIALQGAGQHF
jgi:hypothetical protein